MSLMFSLCAGFGLYASSPGDFVRYVNQNIQQNAQLLTESVGKDVVAFLGFTGAGKSTLVNYLAGKSLCANKNGESIDLVNPNDLQAMQIGIGSNSITELPKSIQIGDHYFYDLPGFEDTKGTGANLLNAAFIKYILDRAKTVKIVFVFQRGDLSSKRADAFKSLIEKARRIFRDERQIIDSSVLVMTNVSKRQEASTLLKEYLSGDTGWLKPWEGKLYQMCFPDEDGLIRQDDRSKILAAIEQCQGKKSLVDVEVFYDTRTLNRVGELFESILAEKFNAEFDEYKRHRSWEASATQNEIRDAFDSEFIQPLQAKCRALPAIRLLSPLSADTYEKSLGKFFRDVVKKEGEIYVLGTENLLRQKNLEQQLQVNENKIRELEERLSSTPNAEDHERLCGQIETLKSQRDEGNQQLDRLKAEYEKLKRNPVVYVSELAYRLFPSVSDWLDRWFQGNQNQMIE